MKSHHLLQSAAWFAGLTLALPAAAHAQAAAEKYNVKRAYSDVKTMGKDAGVEAALVARRAMGWSGRRAAWLSAAGFAVVMLSFLPINRSEEHTSELQSH